jgi:hypothetical protein
MTKMSVIFFVAAALTLYTHDETDDDGKNKFMIRITACRFASAIGSQAMADFRNARRNYKKIAKSTGFNLMANGELSIRDSEPSKLIRDLCELMCKQSSTKRRNCVNESRYQYQFTD